MSFTTATEMNGTGGLSEKLDYLQTWASPRSGYFLSTSRKDDSYDIPIIRASTFLQDCAISSAC
jgi:hypothetical protein